MLLKSQKYMLDNNSSQLIWLCGKKMGAIVNVKVCALDLALSPRGRRAEAGKTGHSKSYFFCLLQL